MGGWDSIDGETPIDISDLTNHAKQIGVTNRNDLDRIEAENIRKVASKYLSGRPSRRMAPFDFSWLLGLHHEMFCDVWNFAGEIRTCDTNIGVPWHQINEKLMNLVRDLKYWEENWPSVLEQAASLHYHSVSIHPFKNGNGRWSRMLANIWLLIHNHPASFWPEKIGESSDIRRDYLEALKKADGGEMSPLIGLHERFLSDETD